MINENIKTVRKFFFVWDEDKEANWLREMSNNGWHLTKASFFKYTFKSGVPKDYVYQFDFSMDAHKNKEEYFEIFKSGGFEFISNLGGWYYFRKEYNENEVNEIYTDKKSLKEKYKKLMFFLMLTGIPLFYNFFIIFRHYGKTNFYFYFSILNDLILVLWLYAFIRVIIYVRKIGKE